MIVQRREFANYLRENSGVKAYRSLSVRFGLLDIGVPAIWAGANSTKL